MKAEIAAYFCRVLPVPEMRNAPILTLLQLQFYVMLKIIVVGKIADHSLSGFGFISLNDDPKLSFGSRLWVQQDIHMFLKEKMVCAFGEKTFILCANVFSVLLIKI